MHLRSIVIAAPLLLGIAAPSLASDTDVAELIALDQRQQRAYIDRDWSVLERIFTDDYVLITSSGRTYTKAEVIEAAASPDRRWEINETSGWQVRVHGDTAIVVATLHQKGVDHGAPFDSVVLFSDTYVREHGTWRNVHAHATRVDDGGR